MLQKMYVAKGETARSVDHVAEASVRRAHVVVRHRQQSPQQQHQFTAAIDALLSELVRQETCRGEEHGQ